MHRLAQALLCLVVVIPAISLSAQSQSVPARATAPVVAPGLFQPGDFLVGPSLLLGNLNGGSLAPGIETEYGLTKNPSLGSGTIGLGFRGHTYSSTTSYLGFSATVRVTPIAVAANYHFVLPDSKIDPYVGLAVGYASVSYSDTQGSTFSISSGTYLMLDGGGRYYLNPRTAIQAGISVGSRGDVGLLRLAAMFKL